MRNTRVTRASALGTDSFTLAFMASPFANCNAFTASSSPSSSQASALAPSLPRASPAQARAIAGDNARIGGNEATGNTGTPLPASIVSMSKLVRRVLKRDAAVADGMLVAALKRMTRVAQHQRSRSQQRAPGRCAVLEAPRGHHGDTDVMVLLFKPSIMGTRRADHIGHRPAGTAGEHTRSYTARGFLRHPPPHCLMQHCSNFRQVSTTLLVVQETYRSRSKPTPD